MANQSNQKYLDKQICVDKFIYVGNYLWTSNTHVCEKEMLAAKLINITGNESKEKWVEKK